VKSQQSLWATSVAFLVIFTIVASCGLPRTGPNKREIFEGSVQRSGDAFVVEVNNRVTRATAVTPTLGFSPALLNAGALGSDTIRAGDTLNVTVWENVDDGLLTQAGGNNAILSELQVDGNGFIFVPYAGRVKAAGNSPEALRRILTRALEDQTPDPQVQVARASGDGATVTIVGDGGQGVFPIERPTRRLSAMIAAAGGLGQNAEIAQITVIRGAHRGTIWAKDMFRDPRNDIALRGGDRILIEADTREFTALGATGTQSVVPFESQALSALEAIAQVGGLSAASADPTGVFVLRNEPAEIANQVLGRTDLIGDQRMVYLLDLTEPNGMFMARDFSVRDGDTVYVTEAPFTQWDKTISALTGSLGSANGLANTVSN
jgi:polysaccharide export outer membrane protein